jgi:energy-coupling factor transporter ATP-binding protein EcfA2
MIRSVSLTNFRCYRDLEIDDLGRLNVIVGDNGSGKTALLEALYLVIGNNAGNALKCRAWRGMGQEFAISDPESYHALWRDLFYGLNDALRVQVVALGSSNRAVRVSYASKKADIPVLGSAPIQWVTFAFQDAKRDWHPFQVTIDKNRTINMGVAPLGIEGAMFSAAGPIGSKETADRFSTFSKRNRQGPIVDALKKEFPRIVDLSVETDASAGAMVHATLANTEQKIPLALLSSGINRWVAYLCALGEYSGGAVMIDEIESGLYYKHLGGMWQSVNELSKAYKTQVFTAVHSRECLEALQSVAKGEKEDVRLIRITHEGKDQPTVRVFSGDQLSAALDSGFELRE